MASRHPPARAWPFTAEIVGFQISSSEGVHARGGLGRFEESRPRKSTPGQNVGPSPPHRTATHASSSARNRSQFVCSSASISGLSAFRRSGRFSVSTARRPRRSYRHRSVNVPPPSSRQRTLQRVRCSTLRPASAPKQSDAGDPGPELGRRTAQKLLEHLPLLPIHSSWPNVQADPVASHSNRTTPAATKSATLSASIWSHSLRTSAVPLPYVGAARTSQSRSSSRKAGLSTGMLPMNGCSGKP